MPKHEENFSDRLKRLLSEKQMSLRAAARIAEVSPATLTNWTSNGAPSDFKAVKRLADALGTSLSFLLVGEHESRTQGSPQITEVFIEARQLFDGYARIQVTELLPRNRVEVIKKEET